MPSQSETPSTKDEKNAPPKLEELEGQKQQHLQISALTKYLFGGHDTSAIGSNITLSPSVLSDLKIQIQEALESGRDGTDNHSALAITLKQKEKQLATATGLAKQLQQQLETEKRKVSNLTMGLSKLIKEHEALKEKADKERDRFEEEEEKLNDQLRESKIVHERALKAYMKSTAHTLYSLKKQANGEEE